MMPEGEERTWPWWTAFGALTAVALWLAWLAYHEALPPEIEDYDKVLHFAIAGLFAYLLYRATRQRSLWPVVALLALFGAEEFAQRFSVHRNASIADFAADVAGVVVFTAVARRSRSKPGSAKPADDVAE